MKPIYLDYNATTPIAREVAEAMLPGAIQSYRRADIAVMLPDEVGDALAEYGPEHVFQAEYVREDGQAAADVAVIDAGAVRFRPMMLTAAAVIVGASVILFDPIFQGLALSLMAGEVASLLLSRMAVPVLYYMANRRSEMPEVE